MTNFGKLVSTIFVLTMLSLTIVVLKPFKVSPEPILTGTTTVPIVEVQDEDRLTETYTHATSSFSIIYPTGYKVDESYTYTALGSGKSIMGTKFTVSAATIAGTNLSSDSYLSVELIPKTTPCIASLFLTDKVISNTITEGETEYSVASTTGAAAGNRYEETVYALPGTNPCVAIRYFIHYGVIENYPEGSVKEFDKAALLQKFEAIRKTLVINQ